MQKLLKRIIKKYLKKDGQKNNKGFTLVELIVVLVILAILAAILVPALLGYIDRAKANQDILNARTLYTAAQTVASERYAQNNPIKGQDADYNKKVREIASLENPSYYGFIGFSNNASDPHAGYVVEVVIFHSDNKDGPVYYMEKAAECKESDNEK